MNKTFRNTLVSLALTSVLAACGGSSDSSDSEGDTQTQASAVSSIGQIDGFGSVIVNGVRYNTDNAVIMVNGVEVDEAELKVGYIVTVTATVGPEGAIATRVEYSAEVIGPVEDIDIDARTITVMGQIVQFSEDTFFDDDIDEDDLEAILANVVIEVSAFISADGTLIAAHIEIETDAQSFRLEGTISNIDHAAHTFSINGQEVDISQVSFGDDEEELSDGMHVVVIGSLQDDVLVAEEEIEEHESLPDSEEGLEVEIEGLVSELADNGSFVINGMRVSVNDETEYEYGDAASLRDGMLVEVEGEINDEGVLVAEEITQHRNAEMEFEGYIDAIDLVNNTFTLHDVVFTVNADTSFDDDSDIDERRFALDDLAVGDALFVLAFTDFEGDDLILAKRIRRRNADDDNDFRSEVMGVIVEIEGGYIELQNGVLVVIGDQTEILGGDLPLDTPEEVIGAVIIAEGVFDNEVLYASAIEILAWCGEDGSVFPTADGEVSHSVVEHCRIDEDDHESEDESDEGNTEEESDEGNTKEESEEGNTEEESEEGNTEEESDEGNTEEESDEGNTEEESDEGNTEEESDEANTEEESDEANTEEESDAPTSDQEPEEPGSDGDANDAENTEGASEEPQ